MAFKSGYWINIYRHQQSLILNKLKSWLPPLAEQRRIAAKLETLLGNVDAYQQRMAKIPVILKRFRRAVLAAACSGQLTVDWREDHECSEWETKHLRTCYRSENGSFLQASWVQDSLQSAYFDSDNFRKIQS